MPWPSAQMGKWLASAGWKGTIKIWDVTTGKKSRSVCRSILAESGVWLSVLDGNKVASVVPRW